MNPSIDSIDRKILAALQRSGRASNVELAAEVHLSAPQCFRRTRALEERGVIRGYVAQVDAEALGYGVTAYVSMSIVAGLAAAALGLICARALVTKRLCTRVKRSSS